MSFAGMSQCIKHCQEMSSSSSFFTRTSQWVQHCLNFFLKSNVSCRVRHIGSTVIKKIFKKSRVLQEQSQWIKQCKEKERKKSTKKFIMFPPEYVMADRVLLDGVWPQLLHVIVVMRGNVVCIGLSISCCILQLCTVEKRHVSCRSTSQRVKMHRHLTACCSSSWRSGVHTHLLLHVTIVVNHWKNVFLQEYVTADQDAQTPDCMLQQSMEKSCA